MPTLAYRCVDLLIEQFRGTNTSFTDYATQHWADHARMAQSRFKVQDSQAEFFQIDSPCREHWLQRLRSNGFLYPRIPEKFSILHIAARWGISTLVDYVFRLGAQEQHAEKSTRFIIDCVDASGVTPLEQAVRSGYPEIVSILLDLGGKVTTLVVKAAAGNYKSGKELMALLLDRQADDIIITADIVEIAAGNYVSGKEVIGLLLDRWADILITEDMVKAAARNDRCGKEVMTLLLDRRADDITITQEVLPIITKSFDEEIVALLFNRQTDDITITKNMMKAAAGNNRYGKEVITLLLDRQTDNITHYYRYSRSCSGKL